jgi:hypothetical protein
MNHLFIRLAPRATNPPHPWQITIDQDRVVFADSVSINVPSRSAIYQDAVVDRFGQLDRHGIECQGHLDISENKAVITFSSQKEQP